MSCGASGRSLKDSVDLIGITGIEVSCCSQSTGENGLVRKLIGVTRIVLLACDFLQNTVLGEDLDSITD